MTLYPDVLFASQRIGKTLPNHSHLLPSLSPTPRCLSSPPVQAFPTLSQRVALMMDQGPQSSSAILSTPLCILARRIMRRCQPFLQIQHPPQHFPHPPTVKGPGAQYISATLRIPLLLLQGHPPPLTRHLSVFQLVQTSLRPCPLVVKDPGTQFTSSAALSILLLLQRVLLATQLTRHQRRFLPVRPPPQRPPVAPRMYNMVI